MNMPICQECNHLADSHCSHGQTIHLFCEVHAQQHLRTRGSHLFSSLFNELTSDQLCRVREAAEALQQAMQVAVLDQVNAMNESVRAILGRIHERRRECARTIGLILHDSRAKLRELTTLMTKGWNTLENGPIESADIDAWINQLVQEEESKKQQSALRLEAQRSFNEAQMHRKFGLYRSAIPQYRESIRIQRQLDLKPDLALSLEKLGLALYNNHEHKSAVQAFQESASLYRDLNFKYDQARALYSKGWTLGKMSKYKSATSMYEESARLQRELNCQQDLARTLHDLAFSLDECGQYQLARSVYEETITIREHISLKYALALVHGCIGFTVYKIGDLNATRKHLQTSCDIYRSLNLVDEVAKTLKHLVIILTRVNLKEEAKKYLEELSQLSNK